MCGVGFRKILTISTALVEFSKGSLKNWKFLSGEFFDLLENQWEFSQGWVFAVFRKNHSISP
jgi:hypothetical protein